MKCDGNHVGPRCADPECWNDTVSTGCAFNSAEPLPYAYPLFKHMSDEHGLTLIDSELYEIMRICKEIDAQKESSE